MGGLVSPFRSATASVLRQQRPHCGPLAPGNLAGLPRVPAHDQAHGTGDRRALAVTAGGLAGAARAVAVGETGGNLADDRLGEPSADIRGRIEGAREAQKARFEGLRGGPSGNVNLPVNAGMPALPAQAHVWDRPRCASTASSMRTAGACP